MVAGDGAVASSAGAKHQVDRRAHNPKPLPVVMMAVVVDGKVHNHYNAGGR